MNDAYYMQLALQEARKAYACGEVPVGAVLIYEGKILARGYNRPISHVDPTAHAEIVVITRAARKVGNYRLLGTTLYVTLEPCIMCTGAIINARIERIVFGARDPKGGAVVSLYNLLTDERLNHRPKVTAGIMEEECGEILSRFFREKRIT